MSQRRNIFTHNDGIISEQYMAVCKREGCSIDSKFIVGDQLSAPPDYLFRVVVVISKVGFMLCHTLWNKLFPNQTKEVQDSVTKALYRCLEDKQWAVAAEIGSFSLTSPMKKSLPDLDLRIRTINNAIALKFSGDKANCEKMISSLDWSASHRDFKLAIAVLQDRNEDAIGLMKDIGKKGELVHQEAYHSWPLFEKLRRTPEFYSAYEDIYQEAYSESVDAQQKSIAASISVSTAADEVGNKVENKALPKNRLRGKKPNKGVE